MELTFIEHKNTLNCRFSGRLTSENSTLFGEILINEIEGLKKQGTLNGNPEIVFDMEDVIYLASAFLRVCLLAAKKVDKNAFSIVNTNQFVKDLLITSGLENIAKIELKRQEEQLFEPSADFVSNAHINSLDGYKQMYETSIIDNENFWSEQAKSNIAWFEPFNKTLEWDLPHAKWFQGGKLNACYNCLDKHLGTDFANKAAIIWEGEPASPNKPGRSAL